MKFYLNYSINIFSQIFQLVNSKYIKDDYLKFKYILITYLIKYSILFFNILNLIYIHLYTCNIII